MANSMFKFQQPLQAIRFADDNIKVGKNETAKDALQYFLSQHRLNKSWTEGHEALAMKFVGLAVDLRQAFSTKDGLIRYRNLTQQHNPASLDRVVRKLVELSLEKAVSARDAAPTSLDLNDVEDLETEANPQELLMSSMTSEGAAERAQRELVVPWVRHAWDIFRNTLDTLRNIPRMEACYQWVAFKAFEFCVSFNRTTEFRKLCDTMRKHLTHWRNDIQKGDQSEQDTRSVLATLERHMRTRFQQLRHCAELSMWSEGFRTVEDIYGLIRLAPEDPADELMAQYYEQLAVIFWKSDDLLFHAYATLQQYKVVTSMPNVDATAAQQLANRLLCAALCVPLFADATTEDERFFRVDFDRDKKDRLARLLNFNETPSRDSLLAILGHMGLAKAVSPDLSALQQNLESKFHPLDLVKSVKPALDMLSQSAADMQQYVAPLEKLTLYRLLMQLTEVYSFLTMDFFDSLVAPLTLSGEELELEVARGCRAQLLKVRLDHCGRCIRLGAESMESGRMRTQLSALAAALSDIVPKLPVDGAAASSAALYEDKRSKVFDLARQSEDGTLAENQKRLQEIEDRNQQAAREAEVKKREKAAEEARERERRAVAEAERLEREQQRRLAERKRLIEEEIHIASVTAYLKSVSRDASSFTREELLEMTVESLQHEQAEKEARSAKRAQESHFKREQELDFFTQALRGKEAEKLQSWIDARLQEDGKYAEQQELSMVERAKKLHADTIVVKERLARMESYIMNFEELVSEKRAAEHEAALSKRVAAARREALQRKVENAMRRKKEADDEVQKKKDAEREARQREEDRRKAEALRKKNEEADAARMSALVDRVDRKVGGGALPPAVPSAADTASKWRASADATPPPPVSRGIRGGGFAGASSGRGGFGSDRPAGGGGFRGGFGGGSDRPPASGGGFRGGFGSDKPPASGGGFRGGFGSGTDRPAGGRSAFGGGSSDRPRRDPPAGGAGWR